MSPERQSLFGRLLATFAPIFSPRVAEGEPTPDSARRVPKAAYHLADPARVGATLDGIERHFAAMGGPTRVHLALVVHGPALAAFEATHADAELARRLATLAAMGLDLCACADTLVAHRLEIDQLLPGFMPVPEGGVVRLARLQAEGYAYLRP